MASGPPLAQAQEIPSEFTGILRHLLHAAKSRAKAGWTPGTGGKSGAVVAIA
jgi:hypothetical protein